MVLIQWLSGPLLADEMVTYLELQKGMNFKSVLRILKKNWGNSEANKCLEEINFNRLVVPTEHKPLSEKYLISALNPY